MRSPRFTLWMFLAAGGPLAACQLLTGTAGKEIVGDSGVGGVSAAVGTGAGSQGGDVLPDGSAPDREPDADASDGDGATMAGPRLYVMGGGNPDWGMKGAGQPSIADVISAPLLSDGTLGPWATHKQLPNAYAHDNPAVIARGYAFIVGEFGTPSSGASGTVLFTKLPEADSWMETTKFSPPRGGWESQYGAATDGTSIFLAGSAGASIQYAAVSSSGGVGAWHDAPSLPVPIGAALPLVNSGLLYVVGTSTSGIMDIFYAPIDPTNGTGAWVDSNISHPYPDYFGATIFGNTVYVTGGYPPPIGHGIPDVIYSTLGGGGTPADFLPAAAMPGNGRLNVCTVAGPKGVYVVGGEYSVQYDTLYDDVLFAEPNSDGSISSWTMAGHLPTPRSGVACAIQ